jgi:hypothetical protein
MTEISNEILHGLLKSIQLCVAETQTTQIEQSIECLHIRVNTDNLRNDNQRMMTMLAKLDARLERLERHLNLADALPPDGRIVLRVIDAQPAEPRQQRP